MYPSLKLQIRKNCNLVLALVTLLPNASYADASLINKLQSVAQEVSKVNKNANKCDLDSKQLSCDMDSLCEQVKPQDMYMYTDSKGYSLTNGPMVSVLHALDTCAGGNQLSSQIKDPFLLKDQFVDAQAAGGAAKLAENKAQLATETKRAKGIYKESMAKIIKVVEGRRNSQNSQQIDNLRKRLRSIKFKVQSPADNLSDIFEQGCEFANAAYNTLTHEISVCPQMLTMPESSLFFIFSHEIAHSIGPCSTAYSYGPKGGANIPDWIFPGADSFKIKIPSIPKKDHPFSSVFQCVQGSKSMALKSPSNEALLAQIEADKQAKIREIRLYDETSPVDAIEARYDDKANQIRKDFDEYSACSEVGGNGYLEESSADWYASQAVALKLDELQSSSQKKEMAFGISGAMLSMNGCANTRQAAIQQAKAIGKGKCEDLDRAVEFLDKSYSSESDSGSHPLPSRRVNRVILAEPGVRDALQCQGGNVGQKCN